MKRVPTVLVPLSKLHPGRDNPRRVKPSAESDQQLLALVRQFGIVQPLIVRPHPDNRKEYQIIAGQRRHRALKQIHRNANDDPLVRCEVRDVDDATAEAIALAENFGREQMHPLDEAESFSRLASDESQGVDAIGAAFGVGARYVRQRMRLANLIKVIKDAFRNGEIDVATASTFASVPAETQKTIWNETGGHPRHADHVRNLIEHAWVDAKHALFDVSTLPEGVVSADLFSERVLVERTAFMAAQLKAMGAETASLREAGWREVVAGSYEDIHDRPLAMVVPEREFDEATTRRLQKIDERRQRWESKLDDLADEDVRAMEKIQAKLEALEAEEEAIGRDAPVVYSEVTKSVGTAFLTLYPNGEVRRDFRVPRERRRGRGEVAPCTDGGSSGVSVSPQAPTSESLGERQLADLFSHQALAVREALLKAPAVRKRVLAMILHDNVRTEALAIRHDPNAVTMHADGESFGSSARQRLKEKRQVLDPFIESEWVDDAVAFERLVELPDVRVNQLVDLLIVECVTTHLQRGTGLIARLCASLKVELRQTWRPDAPWLGRYQKVQLAHLLAGLHGREYNPNLRDERKKSELVDELDRLFASAAEGALEDKETADRVNEWLPSIVRNGAETPAC